MRKLGYGTVAHMRYPVALRMASFGVIEQVIWSGAC